MIACYLENNHLLPHFADECLLLPLTTVLPLLFDYFLLLCKEVFPFPEYKTHVVKINLPCIIPPVILPPLSEHIIVTVVLNYMYDNSSTISFVQFVSCSQ